MQYSLKLLSYKRELGIDSSAKLQLTAYNSTLSCYIELLSNSVNWLTYFDTFWWRKCEYFSSKTYRSLSQYKINPGYKFSAS